MATCGEQSSSTQKIINNVEMIKIPAGEFILGNDSARVDARPAHRVYLDEFYIDRCEVTNAQYKKFIDATGHPTPFLNVKEFPWAEPFNWKGNNYPEGKANQPVVLVDWDDALAYANWRGCRLPTEAEWEKAARGLNNTNYPWGNKWDSLRVNYQFSIARQMTPADSSIGDISDYKILNMAGNVREWCLDWYKIDAYKDGLTNNPKGAEIGSRKLVRGGSWKTFDKAKLTSYYRNSEFSTTKTIDIGFRCVKVIVKDSTK